DAPLWARRRVSAPSAGSTVGLRGATNERDRSPGRQATNSEGRNGRERQRLIRPLFGAIPRTRTGSRLARRGRGTQTNARTKPPAPAVHRATPRSQSSANRKDRSPNRAADRAARTR